MDVNCTCFIDVRQLNNKLGGNWKKKKKKKNMLPG